MSVDVFSSFDDSLFKNPHKHILGHLVNNSHQRAEDSSWIAAPVVESLPNEQRTKVDIVSK